MTSPPPAAYVPLDADHVRTTYLRARGTRLWANQHAVFLPAESRVVTFAFRVAEPGEHGIYRPVLIQPFRTLPGGGFGPTYAWCPKGGDHDLTPAGAACAHMVAADLEFATAVLPDLVKAGTWTCPHPLVDDSACVACGEVLDPKREVGGAGAVDQFRVETRQAVLAVLDRHLGKPAFGDRTVVSPGLRALIADEVVAALTGASSTEGAPS